VLCDIDLTCVGVLVAIVVLDCSVVRRDKYTCISLIDLSLCKIRLIDGTAKSWYLESEEVVVFCFDQFRVKGCGLCMINIPATALTGFCPPWISLDYSCLDGFWKFETRCFVGPSRWKPLVQWYKFTHVYTEPADEVRISEVRRGVSVPKIVVLSKHLYNFTAVFVSSLYGWMFFRNNIKQRPIA